MEKHYKYRAPWYGTTIEKVEIIRETEKSVFFKRALSESLYHELKRTSSSNNYFDTPEEAFDHIEKRLKGEIESAQNRLDGAKSRLSEFYDKNKELIPLDSDYFKQEEIIPPGEEANPLRLFEKLDVLNRMDGRDNTTLLGVSGNFVAADKVKAGSIFKMGCDEKSLMDMLSEKVIPILMIIDKTEYSKFK